MSTAVFELAESIESRIDELNVLVNAAKNSLSSEKLYNVLCRACCVLLASHLEGFLKDFSHSLTADLNYYIGEFRQMPTSMQRAFCEKIAFYEGVDQSEIEARIKNLVSFFGNNSVNIDMSAFPYKENPNKNPGPNFIESHFLKFGINSILNSISIPRVEAIFGNDQRSVYLLKRDVKRFRGGLFNFPYKKVNSSNYIFSRVKYKKGLAPITLWHTFVEDLMTRRHKVAHGDSMSNDTSWEILESDVEKIHILMNMLVFSATTFIVEKAA